MPLSTITSLVVQADLLSRHATDVQYGRDTRLPATQRDTALWMRRKALSALSAVLLRSRDKRTQRRTVERMERIQRAIDSAWSNQRWNPEHRAQRREDNEAWQDAGWYCIDAIDSYTFSTQPFPYEYANSTARSYCDRLRAMGIMCRTESPDHVSRSQRCSYWGGSYSADTGTVCILVKCDTVAELEQIRRAYAANQHEYWHDLSVKHSWAWDKHACGYNTTFRNW